MRGGGIQFGEVNSTRSKLKSGRLARGGWQATALTAAPTQQRVTVLHASLVGGTLRHWDAHHCARCEHIYDLLIHRELTHLGRLWTPHNQMEFSLLLLNSICQWRSRYIKLTYSGRSLGLG